MSGNEKTVKVDLGGLPLFLLFITFMALKLTDVIDWSWWWVTAPLWIPTVAVLLCMGGVFAVVGAGTLIAWARRRR